MLKYKLNPQIKGTKLSRLFWARQAFFRFHLIQNKRMLSLSFDHLGSAFSYLGRGAARLKCRTRARWANSYANKAQVINPCRALSSTLKSEVVLPIAKNAYLNDWFLFSSVKPLPSIVEGFNADLFINAKGFFTPAIRKAGEPTVATIASHSSLQIFLRLRLINNSSFLLFSILTLNLKFVLFFYVQLRPHDVLLGVFCLIKLVLSCQCLRCL